MMWILRQPKRFLQEREALDTLAQEVSWIRGIHWRIGDGLIVAVDIDLDIHGRVWEVDLTYPDAFPDTPAYIRPRDRSQRWSIHQYGEGGSFCLEWRADNWHPGVTGADLLQSLYRLLSTEMHPENPSAVPSAHTLTRGQERRSDTHRLIATPRLIEILAALPPNTVKPIQVRSLLHHSGLDHALTVCLISDIEGAAGKMDAIPDVPKGLNSYIPLFAWRSDGFVIRNDNFNAETRIKTVDDLAGLIADLGFADRVFLTPDSGSTNLGDRLVVVIGASPSSLRCWGIEGTSLNTYAVIQAEDFAGRLPASYAHLKDLRIGIAGLGSVGSKIAVSLARAGSRKFLLIDEDLFLPENVCRNELSWDAVGVHKAEAVKEALSLIAAEIDTDVRVYRLAGQESSVAAASVLKALACCDLIIDATARPEVFTLLAAVAKAHQRPVCWGEVFAGGIGGMIARARPRLDPTPLAVRNGILEHLKSLPPAPYAKATRYDVDGDEPHVADDADVSQIASSLARLALDTLMQPQPSSFPYPAYLIGLRPEWIFSGSFDTHPLAIEGEAWDADATADEDRNAALASLLQILKENADDHPDSPAADPGHNQSSVA